MQEYKTDNTMAALSLLVRNAAYDLDDILTAIEGHCHLLMSHIPEGDPLQVHIDGILSATEQATVVTRTMLTASRNSIVPPQPLPDDAIRDAV